MSRQKARYGVWDQLRAHFDESGDGQITPEEFVNAFKKRVLSLPCITSNSRPKNHTEAMRMLNESINRTLKKELNEYARSVDL